MVASLRTPRMLLALLALASGAGLVALVGWSLFRAVAQSREYAELQARSNARELARAMRAALSEPSVLAAVPAEQRFRVTDGVVEVPEEVGWLSAQPVVGADPVVAEKMRQAQIAEFARGDAAGAARLFEELLGPRGPEGDTALRVLVAAAWQAQRADCGQRVAELLGKLEQKLAAATPARTAHPELADAVAATALLAAARSRPFPWADRLLPALPGELAEAVLARLGENGIDVTTLRAAAKYCGERRALLRDVAAMLPELSARSLVPRGDRLPLWFPTDDHDGDGALVELSQLAGVLTVSLRDHRDRSSGDTVFDWACSNTPIEFVTITKEFADGRVDEQHYEEVVPGVFWVLPSVLPETPLFARPAAVLVAALTLLSVFAGSAFFGARALRQQARAMRARADFLTGVTHELKTPAAAIGLLAEVLSSDDVPPAKQREYFGLLAGESARLSMLVENVLDLGQAERGERAYDVRAGDLAAVVREVVALFAPLAKRSAIATLMREGVAVVRADFDSGAVRQALLNVLDNARKYAAKGGRIELTTSRRDGKFAIAVRDYGAGVPAAERETIFGAFERGSAHRHGSIPGVGLGLHLARAIARRHGGELSCVAPADGGPGAEFVCTLPCSDAEEPA